MTDTYLMDDFYPGCPVTTRDKALRIARFWCWSGVAPYQYRAWVVFWDSRGCRPRVKLFDVAELRLSGESAEPPEMPAWAQGNGVRE